MEGDSDLIDCFDGYQDFARKVMNKKKITKVPTLKDDWYYNMNHEKRGVAIIFNHEHFKMTSLKQRVGTEADGANLDKTLKKLGFETNCYTDLTSREIEDVMDKIALMDHSDHDCLLVVILSHGEKGVIYSKDTAYAPEDLIAKFTPDKCHTLAGKPKIFVIQACQGDKLDCGVCVNTVQVDSGVTSYRIPLYADFLIAYSTIPGYYSWRNTQKGSWFVQAFCKQFAQYGLEFDVLTIFTFVCREVAIEFESNVPTDNTMHKQKQIPCITSMLTRLIKFSPKLKGNMGDTKK